MPIPRYGSHKLPVILRNETNCDITLPINCVIAELFAPDCVMQSPTSEGVNGVSISANCCKQQQDSEKESKLNFLRIGSKESLRC